jgi:predicted RecB family endonuclease
MRVLVTGATTWRDAERIREELRRLPAGSIVIHGDAPGADALARQVARELGLTVVRMVKNSAEQLAEKLGIPVRVITGDAPAPD